MQIPMTGLKKAAMPLAFVAFFVTIWFTLYKPEITKIAKYRREPMEASQQIETKLAQLRAYNTPTEQEREEWVRLEKELERRLPKGRQITQLYAEISELAEKCALVNFNRRVVEGTDSTTNEAGVQTNSFYMELTFESDYKCLVAFINGLQDLDRLVKVNKLEVTRKTPRVGVIMSLKSYYLP